jgi:hypothetical protein
MSLGQLRSGVDRQKPLCLVALFPLTTGPRLSARLHSHHPTSFLTTLPNLAYQQQRYT